MEGRDPAALLERYTAPEEVLEMPSHCGTCGADCTARMYRTHIPFFKVLFSSPTSACCRMTHILWDRDTCVH
jgi:zinc finger protein